MIKINQTNWWKQTCAAIALIGLLGAPLPAFAEAAPNGQPPMTQTYVFTTDGAPKKVLPAGAISVRTAEPWNDTAGYGFTSQRDGNEQAFSVRVPDGDYRVRIELDSGGRPSRTSLWSEDRRLMLPPVVLKRSEKRTVEFIANMRTPYLDGKSEQDVNAPKVGLRGDENISRNWDNRLTISASGPDIAQVRSITIEAVQPRRVFLAGDSTVSDQGGADYASWGQMLPRFLSNNVSVANHARSGETMKSFVTSLRWDKLLSQVREGDIVLIQFAHNDQKKQWPRTYVSAEAGYPAWLRAFVADTQTRGAQVVLISPVARRFFKEGRIENTHGQYDQAVRDVAAELKLPLVDLTQKTTTFYEALGPDISPLAFGQNGADKTHHNAYGAWVIANYVATVITDPAAGLNLKAAPDFVAFDPAKPADPRNFELKPTDWPQMREVVTAVSGN